MRYSKHGLLLPEPIQFPRGVRGFMPVFGAPIQAPVVFPERHLKSLLTNLVSYWKFDEAAGSNCADSHDSNPGTATGTTIVAGKIGNARNFNGSSDKILVAANANLNPGNVSVAAWIFWKGSGTGNGIIAVEQNATGATGASYSLMVIVATSKISFSVATLNNSWNDYPSNTIISTNVWYHLVSTYTSGNLNIYINGSLDKNYVNPTGNLISVSDGLHIGHEDAWINEYFFGIIDEIGIWSRALSAAEVAALYNGGAGLAYPF